MLPEPDLFQCGTPTCGTLGRRRRELEEADRSPGQTVLGPDNQQLTLSRGMLNHLEQGGMGGQSATLIRGRKPVQVYSSLLAPATTNTVMAEQERAAAGLAGSGRRWRWKFVLPFLFCIFQVVPPCHCPSLHRPHHLLLPERHPAGEEGARARGQARGDGQNWNRCLQYLLS